MMRTQLLRLQRHLLYGAIALLLLLVTAQLAVITYFVPAKEATEIEIFTTSWCTYCRQLREFLTANKIPFRETDVEETLRGDLAAYALKGNGVPFSTMGPSIVYGLNKEEIAKAVGGLGHEVKVPFKN